MLAIGAGGLDVAVAMGGGPFYLIMPEVVQVCLKGKLQPWVSAKDIILEILRRLTVKGGVRRIYEYGGSGVECLSVPERATVTNMGAELGATTSIFPSDEQTRRYLRMQGREGVWRPLSADPDSPYDDVIEINLNALEPLIACPRMPDNVKPVREVEGTPVHQVMVGSCTNSSYRDLATVALILRGKNVHPQVSMGVTPGSRQVFEMIARDGYLADFISAGVRVLESACGPCIGMGQAPASGTVSVRTFNRNFQGRSGTKEDAVYLASPEVAAACALTGEVTDPRKLGEPIAVEFPERAVIDDTMILPPTENGEAVEIIRGPNIKPLPTQTPPEDTIRVRVLLKVGDDITTDHIMPAGAKILPLRSNIPAISEHVFEAVDPDFPRRAKESGRGVVIGGSNYGQGSSREHAALAPMYLGVKAVLAKTFARIHRTNLVNFGILPLLLTDEQYHDLEQDDELELSGVHESLREGQPIRVKNVTRGTEFEVTHDLTPREREVLLAGGLLNYTKARAAAPAGQ